MFQCLRYLQGMAPMKFIALSVRAFRGHTKQIHIKQINIQAAKDNQKPATKKPTLVSMALHNTLNMQESQPAHAT